jgi:hypothetical protein
LLAYLGTKIRTRSSYLFPTDSCWAVTFHSVPRGQHVASRSTAASAALCNRGVSAVLSAIPLHMPRTDRRSILLLAYRVSFQRDQHRHVSSCWNHTSHRGLRLIEAVPAWVSKCTVVRLKSVSRLSLASDVTSEPMTGDMSTKAPEIARYLYKYRNGRNAHIKKRNADG